MNSWILQLALPILMGIVEEALKPEHVKEYGDTLFDLVENLVIDSKTQIDDKTVLPVIKALRAGLNIPDND